MRIALIMILATFVGGCAYFHSGDEYKRRDEIAGMQAPKPRVDLVYTITVKGVGHDQIPKEKYCGYLFDDCDDVMTEITRNFRTLEVKQKRSGPGPASAPSEKLIKMDIYEKYSYPRYFLQAMFSTASMTLLPLDYPRYFEVKMYLIDKDKNIEKMARREFKIHHWWWMPMAFAYPFFNERRAVERALLNAGKELAIEIEK